MPIFNSQVDQDDLKKMGELIEFNYPKAVIRVPRDKVKTVAQELLSKYDIDDLDINEPDLETLIREIFEKPMSPII